MGWFGKDDKKSKKVEEWHESLPSDLISIDKERFKSSINENLPLSFAAVSVVSLAIGYRFGRKRPFWQQLKDLQDLRSSDIGPQAPWWRGKVVSVSDGDTIRFVHRTMILQPVSNDDRSSRLNVRLCTIDTPETAKFGKEGQRFGEEAKKKLQELCDQKIVDVKVLQMDQYGRAVAEVKQVGWLWSTYLDEAMLKAGMAEVYLGTGAVYGRLGKEKYLSIMEKAKKKGLGIWSDSNRESAAEYKKRTKE